MGEVAAHEVPASDERSRTWRLLPGIAILCLVHGIFLSEALFGGKILTQIDALLLFEPWASVAPEGFRASNPILLDQSIVVLPWLEFCAERLAVGELPLWNPHDYAGHPLGSMPSSGLFWPLHWIYFAWPSWHFHAWHAWSRLVLAGTFTLLFLREIGLARAAALLGALAFTLCGFNIAWLNHTHTNATIFLPLLAFFVERAARRPSLRLAGALAPFVALLFLSGHPPTSAHVLMALAAYAVLRTFIGIGGSRLSARGLAHLALGGLVGFLMTMPMILPFLEYVRAGRGASVSSSMEIAGAVDVGDALVFWVDPDHFGHPQRGDYTGPLGPHLNYQELVGIWVGRSVLLLAGVGLVLGRRDRRVWIFATIGLLAVLVAYQAPPLYDLLRAVPLVNNTKLLRILFVAAFALCVLAAVGVDGLQARIAARRSVLAQGLGYAACLIAALELGTWGYGYNPTIERDSPAFLPRTPVTDFLAGDTTLHRVLGTEGSMLLPNANLFYDVDMLTGYDSIEPRTLVELASRLSTDPLAELSLKEARWFDRMLPLASLLNVKYVLSKGPLPAPLELVLDGSVQVWENPDVVPRAFVARGARVIADSAERLDELSRLDFDPLVAVLEAESSSSIAARAALHSEPPGAVRVETYEPRRVVLRADMQAPGLVVLADCWDTGWSARVDGEERAIERVDHTLRGVWVDEGRSVIEMTYAPRSFRLGVWIAGGALFASIVVFLVGGRAPQAPTRERPILG